MKAYYESSMHYYAGENTGAIPPDPYPLSRTAHVYIIISHVVSLSPLRLHTYPNQNLFCIGCSILCSCNPNQPDESAKQYITYGVQYCKDCSRPPLPFQLSPLFSSLLYLSSGYFNLSFLRLLVPINNSVPV